jgi:hypothetical protein
VDHCVLVKVGLLTPTGWAKTVPYCTVLRYHMVLVVPVRFPLVPVRSTYCSTWPYRYRTTAGRSTTYRYGTAGLKVYLYSMVRFTHTSILYYYNNGKFPIWVILGGVIFQCGSWIPNYSDLGRFSYTAVSDAYGLVRNKKKGVTERVTHGVILTIDPRRRPSMCHHTI